MALAPDEHSLIALFTCYLYYVVIQLFVLFVFVHYTTSVYTCSIRSYLLYICMYNDYIRMLKAVHATDQRVNIRGGNLFYMHPWVYSKYTDHG